MTGGRTFNHFASFAGSGVKLRDAAQAWLVDCTVTGGWISSGTPPFAIDNGSTFPVRIERCALSNGNVFGPATQGVVLNQLLLGASLPTTQVSPGGNVSVTFRTRPGLFVAYHVGFRIAAPTTNPLLAGPEWGFLANSIFLDYLLPDAQGIATSVLAVPNIPGLVHLPLWFTGWTAVEVPVAVSAPVGLVLR